LPTRSIPAWSVLEHLQEPVRFAEESAELVRVDAHVLERLLRLVGRGLDQGERDPEPRRGLVRGEAAVGQGRDRGAERCEVDAGGCRGRGDVADRAGEILHADVAGADRADEETHRVVVVLGALDPGDDDGAERGRCRLEVGDPHAGGERGGAEGVHRDRAAQAERLEVVEALGELDRAPAA
jgi:hypothetical protein